MLSAYIAAIRHLLAKLESVTLPCQTFNMDLGILMLNASLVHAQSSGCIFSSFGIIGSVTSPQLLSIRSLVYFLPD